MDLYCQYCGTKIRENAKFCEGCGRKIKSKEETKKQMKDELREELKQELIKEIHQENQQGKKEKRRTFSDYFILKPNKREIYKILVVAASSSLTAICIEFILYLSQALQSTKYYANSSFGFPLTFFTYIRSGNAFKVEIDWLHTLIVYFFFFIIISIIAYICFTVRKNKKI